MTNWCGQGVDSAQVWTFFMKRPVKLPRWWWQIRPPVSVHSPSTSQGMCARTGLSSASSSSP